MVLNHTLCGEEKKFCPIYGKEDTKNLKKCPVYRLFLLIGRKWTLHILQEFFVSKKNLRFNELQSSLDWITPKVLSKRLKELVAEKLVERKIFSETVPLKVEYSLTKKGKDLGGMLKEAKKWCIKWEFRE